MECPVAYYKQKSLDFGRNSSHVIKQRSRSSDFSSNLRNSGTFLLPHDSEGSNSEEMLRCLPSESSENLAITWKTSETDEVSKTSSTLMRL